MPKRFLISDMAEPFVSYKLNGIEISTTILTRRNINIGILILNTFLSYISQLFFDIKYCAEMFSAVCPHCNGGDTL